MAALVVAAGVLRVFFGAKGYEYYLVNIFFWAKMALFVGVALLSVAPTYMYLVWRRRFAPTHHSARRRTKSPNCAGSYTLKWDCSP